VDLYDVWRVLERAGAPTESALVVGSDGEIYADVDADHLRAVVAGLMSAPAWHHLSAITAQPREDGVEVLYHFWCRGGVTLRVKAEGNPATVPSIVPQLPGAEWYEREAREMTGLQFTDGPEPKPLVMPDDWTDAPPLAPEPEAGGRA